MEPSEENLSQEELNILAVLVGKLLAIDPHVTGSIYIESGETAIELQAQREEGDNIIPFRA